MPSYCPLVHRGQLCIWSELFSWEAATHQVPHGPDHGSETLITKHCLSQLISSDQKLGDANSFGLAIRMYLGVCGGDWGHSGPVFHEMVLWMLPLSKQRCAGCLLGRPIPCLLQMNQLSIHELWPPALSAGMGYELLIGIRSHL